LVTDYLSKLPLIALLFTNIIPLVGVLFFKWDAFVIVLLYWAENLAIGFYNVLKIAFVKVPNPAEHLGKLFIIPFFIVHYGGFMAIHGVFILVMFKKSDDFFPGHDAWPCFFVFVQLLINVIREAYLSIPPDARYVILAMFISHGISFGYNYLYRGEYAKVDGRQLMGQPYGRIVVMHIAIIAGGFVTAALGSPLGLLVILVVLKTIIDVKLHLREHRVKTKKSDD